ncbi:MAG: restriction endonuclease subunit S [Anaerolineae bacterium]|nr:restriction endonuclease subunit S [Anaerolineae bacterium]
MNKNYLLPASDQVGRTSEGASHRECASYEGAPHEGALHFLKCDAPGKSLRRYPAYKDSGVPWLGDVPAHWDLHRAKFLFHYKKDSNTNGEQTNILSLTLRGVVNNDPNNPEGLVPKDYSTYQKFNAGDLVFKLIDLENRQTSRVGLVHEDGIMSPAYVRLIPNTRTSIRYFYHQFFDLYLRGVFNQLGSGVRSTLGPNDLLDLRLSVPPPDEAEQIAAFLDAHDRQTRRYIHAQQRLIKLLTEQKQVLIQQAVTRGLDHDVPLKDSGIPWLGKIPAHWETRRNSRIFSERNSPGREDLPIMIVSLNSGVTIGEEIDDNGRPRRLIEDRSNYKFAAKGDIAYNMMRMWQGAVGVVPTDGLVSPAYVVAHPLAGINSQYFEYLFRTGEYKNEVNRNSRGIVSDRNRLYWDGFKSLVSLVPPVEEQNSIVEHITSESTKIDNAIERTHRQIVLVREYRTRLIADVVTGKLDVRDVVLPDLEDDESVDDLESIETDEDNQDELGMQETDD